MSGRSIKISIILVALSLAASSCSDTAEIQQHSELCKEEAGILVVNRALWDRLNASLNVKGFKKSQKNRYVDAAILGKSEYTMEPFQLSKNVKYRAKLYDTGIMRNDYLIRSYHDDKKIAIVTNYSLPMHGIDSEDYIMCFTNPDFDYDKRIFYVE